MQIDKSHGHVTHVRKVFPPSWFLKLELCALVFQVQHIMSPGLFLIIFILFQYILHSLVNFLLLINYECNFFYTQW